MDTKNVPVANCNDEWHKLAKFLREHSPSGEAPAGTAPCESCEDWKQNYLSVNRANAELRSRVSALEKYAQHKMYCSFEPDANSATFGDKCSCGLSELLSGKEKTL